jgi:hypothetical protein
MVQPLDTKFVDLIYAKMREGYAKLEEGDTAAAEVFFLAAWNDVPEPKYSWDISQITVSRIARMFLRIGRLDEARLWTARIHDCDPEPGDGIPFVLQGAVEFAAENWDEARSYFKRAYEASGRRAFRGEDPRFLKLIAK